MGTTPNLLSYRRGELIHNVCLLAHGLLARYPAGIKLDPADYELIAQQALVLHRQIVTQVERQLVGAQREDFEEAVEQAAQSQTQTIAPQGQAMAGATPPGARWTQEQTPTQSTLIEVTEPARPSQNPGPFGIGFPPQSHSCPEDLSASTWPGATPQNPS